MGVVIWLTGGSLFSPGPVSAISKPGLTYSNFSSHADFEAHCSYCHQPLQANQAELCMNCHTEIAAQVDQHQGTHGKLDSTANCASCHKEHLGKDYDPVQASLKLFDHNQTSFPLAGKHGQIACDACHKDGNFSNIQPTCVSCHAEPSLHAGMYGLDCATCHTSTSWNPAILNGQAFTHEATSFSLVLHGKNRQGQAIVCSDCHQGDPPTSPTRFYDTKACIDCHSQNDPIFMKKHIDQYRPSCIICHDGRDRMHNFNHANFFPLTGKHAEVACESCHTDKQYHGTPADCASCHKEPPVHVGFFGLKCQLCHTSQAWQPAKLTAHSFPPQHGGNGTNTCQTCHTGPYTQYTCYGCHDHQADEIAQSHGRAGIPSDQLPDCTSCHLDGEVHKVKAP